MIWHSRVEVDAELFLHAQVSGGGRGAKERPAVVFSHGFITAGTENHGMFVRLAREANGRGFSTVLFDYEGTGYSDGNYESFRISRSIDHLVRVCRWTLGNAPCDGRLILFGQSLGSALALMASSQLADVLKGAILWNLSSDFERRYPSLFNLSPDAAEAQCVRKGYLVGGEFLKDASRFDVTDYARNVGYPALLLNCVGDSVGDVSIAERAASLAGGELFSRVQVDATHSFECQRPEEKYAAALSFDWLEGVLADVT
jgi:pimeloyl-ACP methyl ester carboxylesterase